ncbi:MAG: phenylalanine--tRNA ligase subunit beta [Clostridia bacterium]|nr:phenylalanine--tRNA ligase subunit beta [Clostridia bacterium]
MNLSKKWLSDYISLNVTDKEFADGMTLSGSKVEGFEKEGSELKNIVVGKVEQLERHPDSDHLWVCQINIGEENNIQIVTGAQNLKEGDFVPVALHKSVVHGGQKITKGKLRGVESNGMLCSVAELGLTVNDFPYAIEDGIFVLGDDCDLTLGKDICEAIGLDDVVTEFEITSNRADCMCVTGLAREAAATFGCELNIKSSEVKTIDEDVNDYLTVSIENPDKCYRYCGAIVKNVRIKPSPRWLRERLRASGVRPINNIVDITNYVMLEFGQPMHAFDLRYLKGGKVIVRNARNDETITTLDDVERKLDESMLVIADAESPVAVAGIMGGEFSSIMDDTTTIVFESACFNGSSIRRTAKALGMRTEASSRYEKELSPESCMTILQRALELVNILDAGDVLSGIVDCYVNKAKKSVVKFEPDWVNNFIGINVSAEKQKEMLEKIGFTVENGEITAPYFRNDIEHKADIAEEIARFYGFHNIENRPLSGVANAKLTPIQQFTKNIDFACRSCGLDEISTFSFISPKGYDKIRLDKDSEKRNSVVILNPLGEDTSVMRTTPMISMMEILSKNFKSRNESVSLYEISTEYISNGLEELPDENQKICIGMFSSEYNFFVIKGIVEEILGVAGASDYDIEAVTDNSSMHPGRTAKFFKGDKEIALFGEVHPEVQKNFGISTKVYYAEIDLNNLFEISEINKQYKPLPKFPAMTRDLAFVCENKIPVLNLEKTIKKAIGPNLEEITLFDVYTGEQIAEGMKSVAFNLKLRSPERTLTDEEADCALKKAIDALGKLGIELRS